MRDAAHGALVALAVLMLTACVTQLDVTCHYVAGVGYVCSGDATGGNQAV